MDLNPDGVKQDTSEWLQITQKGKIDYHERQFKTPYRSTVVFCDWLESLELITPNKSLEVADMGAGEGANLSYLAQRFPNSSFTGIDLNPDLVNWGNDYFTQMGRKNCRLLQGDLYQLDPLHKDKYNGLVSFQTLSWLPEYKTPIKKMAQLKPEWIALTSLFFERDVDCKIIVRDYTLPLAEKPYRESYYNVYPLPLVQQLFFELGYEDFYFIPFEIDIDLPRPANSGMGTYTETLQTGRRIQISGPLLMNWYFIAAIKR